MIPSSSLFIVLTTVGILLGNCWELSVPPCSACGHIAADLLVLCAMLAVYVGDHTLTRDYHEFFKRH